MAKTGRAVVTYGQDFDVEDFPVPDPAPGGLLLRQELAGICGTDLHNWQNGIKTPTLLGHEAVGIIEALGAGLTHDVLGNPLKEGDRIVFHPRNNGVAYGFRGPDQPFTGGFADYIHISEPNSCIIKTNAPAKVGVLAEPFTVGVHSVMRANVQLGDTVIVQGSGAIGLMTLACAKLSGAAKLIIIGGPAPRLELAKRLGADVTIDLAEVPDVEERKALVMSHTTRGKGADVVFECAGFLPAFPEGLSYVREDGVFVEVGHFVDTGTVVVNPHQHFLRPNLRLEGVWGSRHHHFIRGMALLENNELPFADMVSHVLPLEEIRSGFDALNGSYKLGDEVVIKIAVGSAAS
ncbi:MAG: zinc-binding dehydrogenase [Caldilineaceae bacterium]|nr:zinc-binding dehydrogenase [Caldilineaceae bacterium]